MLQVLIAIGCTICCTARSDDFNAAQTTALRVINYYRKLAGLPLARLDARLCRAAQGHAEYRLRNTNLHEDAHSESVEAPGYTGQSFTDRLQLVGYDLREGSFGECISVGENTAIGSVDALVRVPYHRFEYLLGGRMEVGIGVATGNAPGPGHRYRPTVWVYDMAGAASPLSVWPPDDSTCVPTVGGINEIPDPLRIHEGASRPGGYVITVGLDRPYYLLEEAKLTTLDGNPVPIYVNHAGNDPFCSHSFLLIPKEVLRAFTTYVVEIKLATEPGARIEKRWKFVTGTATFNFEYAVAGKQFPEIPKGGKRYSGTVSGMSEDQHSITIVDVRESTHLASSAQPHLAPATAAAARNYIIEEDSKLHDRFDPLGVDQARTIPHSGQRVIFTTDPMRPATIKDLLIVGG